MTRSSLWLSTPNAQPLSERVEQFSQGNSECLCESIDVYESRIPLSPLDSAKVRPVNPGSMRQFFLRQPAPFP